MTQTQRMLACASCHYTVGTFGTGGYCDTVRDDPMGRFIHDEREDVDLLVLIIQYLPSWPARSFLFAYVRVNAIFPLTLL